MPLLPLLTIILPLVGAGGTVGLSLLPRVRPHARLVALAMVGFVAVTILVSRWIPPEALIPSLWRPSLLFGTTLVVQNDAMVQPLAFALALVSCSVILVELSRTDQPHPRMMATLQVMLAAGCAALWAANLLTTLICWAIYDLLLAAGQVVSGGSVRMAVRSLIFGGLATLLLWGGATLAGRGMGSALWSLTTASRVQLTLWALAGLLRLWAYPFYLSMLDNSGVALSLLTPLALGPILGWGLWLRLAVVNGGPIPGGPWVLALAAINLGLGGFLAWSCGSMRRSWSWIGMAATGAVLLAAGVAGESGVAVVAVGGTAWVLAVGVMLLGDGLRREALWWSIPRLLGALALLGLPLTVGFVPAATMVGGLVQGGHLGWGGAFFFGYMFLVAALVRRLLAPPALPVPDRRWVMIVRGIGLGVPALLLVLAGLYPPLLVVGVRAPLLGQLLALPGWAGWLLWAGALASGGALAWQEGAIRSKIELVLNAIHDLLCLEWLYRAIIGALERGLSVLWAAGEVVGGRGALLWSWLLFLLLLLVWGSR